jgi:hypothetical protein
MRDVANVIKSRTFFRQVEHGLGRCEERWMAARVHFSSLLEWVAAAALMGLIVMLGSIVIREFRNVSALMPVSARETSASVPASLVSVRPRMVSIPLLLLDRDKEIRIGDSRSQVESRLGDAGRVENETVERGAAGERLISTYQYGGRRFSLAFEPFEPGAEPRVSAIYVQ